MQQKAEVLEIKQVTQETAAVASRKLDHIEKEILKRVRTKKEAVWEIGQLLFEAAKMYKYREGFMEWVKEKFSHEFCHSTALNYIGVFYYCPKKELIQHFPLKLLYRVTKDTFPEKLRNHILSNAERFNKDISERELKEIAEYVRKIGFDPDNPQVQKLLEDLEVKDKQYRDREKNEDALKNLDKLWNAFDAAAETGLDSDDDGEIWLTEEQEKMPIRKKLTELGYLTKYKVFVETTYEISTVENL